MPDTPQDQQSLIGKIRCAIFGAPKYLKDPRLFHNLALIPILA